MPTVFKRFVSWIRFVLRCSKDSFRGLVSSYGIQKIRFVDSLRYGVQKIRFVDSFRPTAFKRFISWIRFVTQFSKDSFCGFVS